MGSYWETIYQRRQTLKAYCLQDWNELAQLAPWIEQLKPKIVVEIGICEGGWPYLLAPWFASRATIIGIDLMVKFPNMRDRLHNTAQKLRGEGFRVDVIQGRSDDNTVLAVLTGHLAGDTVDVLHIDGAHDYENVRNDWEKYGPLVRSGGLVVFHDVRSRAAGEKVYKVWDEICAQGTYKTTEIGTLNRVGIGIVEI